MKTKLLALAMAVSLAAGWSPASRASQASDLFDAAIADGLPAELSLPDATGTQQKVVVTERLDAGLDAGPDGQEGAIYLVHVDGRPGTLVRLGDELDIALDEAPPGAFAPGRARRSARYDGDGFAGYGDLLQPDEDALHDPSELYSHGPGQGDGLHVWIFLHDKANETSVAKVLNWYMSWWVRDMKTNVSPQTRVQVSVRHHIRGLTDMDYHRGDARDRIWDVSAAASDYVKVHEPTATGNHKYVLLVGDTGRNWDDDVKGLSLRQYGAALASNTGFRHVVGHEVGHLLGARDESNDQSPFHCTYTMGPMTFGKLSCQLYSRESGAEIRSYLELMP